MAAQTRVARATSHRWQAGGPFLPGLFLADAAAAGWLSFARNQYLDMQQPAAAQAGLALLAAVLSWTLGLHRPVVRGARRAGEWLAFVILLVATEWALGHLLSLHGTAGRQVWFGATLALLLGLIRLVLTAPGGRAGFGTVLRAAGLGAVVTAATLPFYRSTSIGAGDAYWYSIMLADVVEQVRHGIFPVWVGQSEYAFNGTVYPLRVAPAFQYAGALMDVLTARALPPTALKNATLVMSALAGAFSAYAFLRAIMPRRATLAALLAGLWIASPGVLAPLMRGDQYMTFMTLPFVPMVLYGSWRVWAVNDAWARVWLGMGLAGTLLSHAPIALWLLLLAGCLYLAALLIRRDWRNELRWLPLLGAVTVAGGAWPVISALTLDNQVKIPSSGASALHEVRAAFPQNFLPIDPAANGLTTYQLGYALLMVFAGVALLLWRTRPRGSVALTVAALAVAPFTLPVPGVTSLLWTGLIPGWFVTINNVWPMQRLFLIWGALIVFAFAAAARAAQGEEHRRLHQALLLALALGAGWSAHQAHQLAQLARATAAGREYTQMMESKDNVILTRYTYSSFSSAPTYASHSYMEPWLENRLLDRESLQILVANADAAAPRVQLDQGQPTHPRLLASGVLQAQSVHQSDFHDLLPVPVLPRGENLALRVEPLVAVSQGHLQLLHDELFREFMLPDSGAGFLHPGPPRAFGTLPTSSKVIPLRVSGPGEPVTPSTFRVILPRRGEQPWLFAEYWLYRYERPALPVAVDSWIPYRARTEVAQPAYLETPRLWLEGWRAWRNGRAAPVARSPNNLVMVPVEPGENVVTLRYHAPLLLRGAFWVAVVFWSAAVLAGGYALLRRAAGASRAAG